MASFFALCSAIEQESFLETSPRCLCLPFPTVFSARQMINHGHIRVNKKRVNIASYVVKGSDLIEIREKSKKLVIVEGSIQSKERDVPEYIQIDDKNKTAKLIRVPKFSEVPFPVVMEPNLVIEYYSR
mgnify:CR=1 FL=1